MRLGGKFCEAVIQQFLRFLVHFGVIICLPLREGIFRCCFRRLAIDLLEDFFRCFIIDETPERRFHY